MCRLSATWYSNSPKFGAKGALFRPSSLIGNCANGAQVEVLAYLHSKFIYGQRITYLGWGVCLFGEVLEIGKRHCEL